LLIVNPDAGKCLLVDWKTNRIQRGEEEHLRKQYRPQIAAYWKAVAEITKQEVEAGIFVTATGEFVVYDASELETEWERLRALPADELTQVISTL